MYRIRKGMWVTLFVIVVCQSLFSSTNQVEVRQQKAFYVDAIHGNDTNSGIQRKPFQTIEKARAEVAKINNQMSGDIDVYLKSGTYQLTDTLHFGASDSGTNGYTIHYQAFKNEVPVISGGTTIPSSSWTLVDKQKNIYRTSVTGLENFRQLYVNDSLAVRARFPNMTEPDTFGPYLKTSGADAVNKYFVIDKADLPLLPKHLNQVEMVIHPHWYHENLHIDKIKKDPKDASKVRVYPAALENKNGLSPTKGNAFYTGDPYYWENDLSFLDAEGEWYLDKASAYLYYKPRAEENMTTVRVIVPQVEQLMALTGTSKSPVHDLTFSRIYFQYTNWTWPDVNGLVATQGFQPLGAASVGAVEVQHANRLAFIDNTFQYTAGNGLQLVKGVKDSKIVNNSFDHIGGNGIFLDSSSVMNATDEDLTDQILIGNNRIMFPGQVVHNGIGIMASWVKNTIIEHNDVNNAPYMGIQLGNQSVPAGAVTSAGYNTIRFNQINDVMKVLDDGGGIYTLARQVGTYIHDNYIFNVNRGSWAMDAPVVGIYHDNCSEYMTDENNVLQIADSNEFYLQTNTNCKAQNIVRINNSNEDKSIQKQAGRQSSYVEPIRVQAESMLLTGYTVENNADLYSNESGVKTSAKGSASFYFKGKSGAYKLRAAYVGEKVGNPAFTLYINNVKRDSWPADFASSGLSYSFMQHVVGPLWLHPGDEIKVTGTVADSAQARLDFIEVYQ
ncbi:hypothetical protein GK047_14065 [Paenibacillus sp. SYP-B3998]|uniref:GH141-like insertion domain-containing protein n=1 Tax=Paenibacillus sp. SYP-B3998 TaxID=2678564 RepID=A0A6G3ZZX3_9BACL|nr:right-handed parallel beta-helix repeat-containing protein [Paenibacillus sp. SYP-B3998]NEW07129.1 hypothetical protein [Paenibacillus sp. SYP-B3998]